MSFGVIKASTRVLVAGLLIGSLAACGGGGSDEVAPPGGVPLPEGSNSAGAGSESVVVPDETVLPEDTGSADTDPVVDRSALLSWDAPSTRVNNTSISMGEIDRYVIRYGQDLDELDGEIVVPESGYGEASYRITNLDRGWWFFSVQAVDTDGLMSAPSDIVSKRI